MVEQERPVRRTGESGRPSLAVATAKQPPAPYGFLHVLRTLRTLVLLVLAVTLLGVTPAALAGAFFGLWRLPFLPAASHPTAVATTAPDLALPRPAWVAIRVAVLDAPAGRTQVAALEPGFPVTLIEDRQAGGALWTHIRWTGPTKAAGGTGWAPAAAFSSFGAGTASIGDLAAFSPALAHALAPDGPHVAAALYFPDSGFLYHANADQPFALGDGFRAALLVATLAHAEATHTAAPPLYTLALIAMADPTTDAAAYKQLGDADGISSYLAGIGVAGVQPSPGDWTGAQAPVTSVLAFYDALFSGHALNDGDRSLAYFFLERSDTALVAAIGGAKPLGGAGPLIAAVKQQQSGWTVSAVGIAAPTSGLRYLVVAVARDLPTQDAAQSMLASFFQQLAPLVAGP
jgi:hypothetical protein